MRRFSEGQQVICVHPTGMWLGIVPGPFMNDIVTINKYSAIHSGYVELKEYPVSRFGNDLPDCYAQDWFKPIGDITELTEVLNAEPIAN